MAAKTSAKGKAKVPTQSKQQKLQQKQQFRRVANLGKPNFSESARNLSLCNGDCYGGACRTYLRR